MQTSRERTVTNRSRVDKDSVSQLFIVFLGAKKKKKKCEEHRKKQVKVNDSIEQKRGMQKQVLMRAAMHWTHTQTHRGPPLHTSTLS